MPALREQPPAGIEGFVPGGAHRGRIRDDGVDHHLAPVLGHPGAVAAEDHRELFGTDPHAA